MPHELPARPDLDQLRRQAKDILSAAKAGDREEIRRIREVSDRLILASAQLALAREHGFASWARLKVEVERRAILNDRDLVRLKALLADEPALATAEMVHWCDHPQGASPLGYTAMLRYDTSRDAWRDLSGTGAVARLLLDAGAPVNGDPSDSETPLMTAASYGDAEVARELIKAGADLESTASPDSGGVPGGTALLHAAVFGMTDVVDVLVASGAKIRSIEEAAAAGDVVGWLDVGTPLQARIRSLVMAADHERLSVIDQLIAAGTPVDAVDADWGRQALRVAAMNGRAGSVRQLLLRGADPDLRDEHQLTALDWCRRRHAVAGESPGHEQVATILQPLTSGASPS